MKTKLLLLLLLCMAQLTVNAQKDTSAVCNVGDVAPPLRVKEWIKGTPVNNFEKGKVYVVDFWATWCRPCILSMPHLSELAQKYKGNVTFAAVDVLESEAYRVKNSAQVKTFVDGMGRKMNFNIALEDTNFTNHDWREAFHQDYIPVSFVINGQGNIAWIGLPRGLDTVLQKVLNNTWNMDSELSARAYENYMDSLDYSIIAKAYRFRGKYSNLDDLGFPDSTLRIVDSMVKIEPKLKYMPWMVSYTFTALLRIDPHKAYEYGKDAIVLSPYRSLALTSIISGIRDDTRKLTTPKEIYLFGAECIRDKIDSSPNLMVDDLAAKYNEMADWYRHGGDKPKAIAAEKQAVKFWEKELAANSH